MGHDVCGFDLHFLDEESLVQHLLKFFVPFKTGLCYSVARLLMGPG